MTNNENGPDWHPDWTDADGWPTEEYFREVATRLETALGFTFGADEATYDEHGEPVDGSDWLQNEAWEVVYSLPPHLYQGGPLERWHIGVVVCWNADEPADGEPPTGDGWTWGPLDDRHGQRGWVLDFTALPVSAMVPEPAEVVASVVELLRGKPSA